MKRIIALVAAGIILAPIATMAATVFNRSLRLGDSGADVVALQRLLNKNIQTQVSVSGAGSPGQESSYFGAKTKQAVARFQELHAAEILTPSGLAFGNGFVGPRTLLKLNSLSGAAGPATPATTIFSLSPSSALPGEMISVYGDKFGSEPLTVKFGKSVLSAKRHPTATNEVLFAIPAGTASGIYSVVVSSIDGSSSNSLKIRVIGGGAASLADTGAPIITGISPRDVTYGDTITITGKNFSTSADNVINLSYEVISGVASPDGQHLSFVVNPPIPRWNPANYEAGAQRPVWELWVSVDSPKGSGELSTMSFNFTP